ncbi:hypothetical protein F5884DRAFT_674934 [Xylogone sp. PMI_703]|nr:hypothetical protein F5884DRAFT_674934 [Xylogone sp. PMI_703]
MEIIALGMCRTGTQSLADGLGVLGYGPIYHMREVHKNGHGKYWMKALEAHFERNSEPFGRKEFDEFLGNFAGVSDLPAAILVEELMDAYPDAKIILTTRDEDKWFESMKSTIWHAESVSPLGQRMKKWLWGEHPQETGKAVFRQHNLKVITAAKERGRPILEYEVKQGWEPLCKFLGKEIPVGVEFPRNDDWASYKKEHGLA